MPGGKCGRPPNEVSAKSPAADEGGTRPELAAARVAKPADGVPLTGGGRPGKPGIWPKAAGNPCGICRWK